MQFQLLGPVEAYHGGRRIDLGRRQERCLLGLLVLRPGQVVSIGRLLSLLWDDNPPPNARRTLHTYVARLRARLAPFDVTLTHRSGGYLIDIDPQCVDVHRATQLVADARALTEPSNRSAVLAEALALWRGPLLADVADDRLRERLGTDLDGRRSAAVELRAEADLACGRNQELVEQLAVEVERYPAQERLTALLMTALYRGGRQADALAAYRRTRKVLAAEFGIEPDPQLQRLHQQMLRNDPELSVAIPGSPGAGRRYLPRDMPDFVGRGTELAAMDELIAADASAPAAMLISGTAGVGKTALAVHWAHRVADQFPDAQLYIDLRGYAAGDPVRPTEAASRLLRALGVPAEELPLDPDEAAAVYRSILADRRALVVLDNANSADQVRGLLPAGPASAAIITSRARLSGLVAREGVRRVDVGVLAPSDATALLARTLGDRVVAEPAAALELVRVCARLPLALRIAAANLVERPHLPIAHYVSDLAATQPLDALEIDGDVQASVRTAFDLSYDGLDVSASVLFCLLCSMPGPDLTVAAAAALAAVAPDEASWLLELLANAGLLEQPSAGRYVCHDLLRVYGRERAQQDILVDTAANAFERLCSWYLDMAVGAARMLYPDAVRLPFAPLSAPFSDQREASAWLEAEHLNLIAVTVRAANDGPYLTAARLADALRPFLRAGRFLTDWAHVARAAVAAAAAVSDSSVAAAAQVSLSEYYVSVGSYAEGIAAASTALDHARNASWPAQATAARNVLANAYTELGQLEDAVDVLGAALALSPPGVAWRTLNNLGVVLRILGRLDEAAEHYTRAIALNWGSRTSRAMAGPLVNLGESQHQLGQFEKAKATLTAGLQLARQTRNLPAQANALANLAAVLLDTGDYADAQQMAESARRVVDGVDDPPIYLITMTTAADVARAVGDYAAAASYYRQVLTTARAHHSRLQEIDAVIGLASTHEATGDYETAQSLAGEAATLAHAAGSRLQEGRACGLLAEVLLRKADRPAAARAATEALAIHRETGHRLNQASTLLTLGYADERKRIQYWRDALVLFTELGSPDAARVRQLLARSA